MKVNCLGFVGFEYYSKLVVKVLLMALLLVVVGLFVRLNWTSRFRDFLLHSVDRLKHYHNRMYFLEKRLVNRSFGLLGSDRLESILIDIQN